MSTIPSNPARISSQMSSDLLLSNLRRTNAELLQTQQELATGKRINQPSDDPANVGRVQSLRRVLEKFDQRTESIGRARDVADQTDAALGELSDMAVRAESIASSQIGVASSAEQRAQQAQVVDGILRSAISTANRKSQDLHLFAGRSGQTRPFVEKFGGVQYLGASEDLGANLGEALPLGINTNGDESLGALSQRVTDSADLDPDATAATRLADVAGARDRGVSPGAVRVTINGSAQQVDLSSAATLGDVRDKLNDAIGGAGNVSITADGFTLTAGAGNTISISDPGTGVTAQDLGIDVTASSGSTAGADIDPKLTELTPVGALDGSLDLSSGLKISNGPRTETISFTGATTVQDMLNRVNGAGMGVRMRINEAGTGFELLNEVSGTAMSVGENSGGSTATDLGLRTFDTGTELNALNHGDGVSRASGENDLAITLSDGTDVQVNLDGAVTVGDVIGRINTAGGGDVTASLAADGNGLVLTDTTGGGGTMSVESANNSGAAADLGIDGSADASGVLRGDDVARVKTDSVFTHLIDLRDALNSNDGRALTEAGERLDGDAAKLAESRARIGARTNRLESEKQRTEDRRVQTRSLLSGLRDTDFAGAISRFQQLQQQLQANLQLGQRTQQLSLLNFLS